MKHRNRKVPEERSKDRYEKLLAENKKLRKQVAQLQKQLSKIHNREQDIRDIMEEYETYTKSEEILIDKKSCPQCGSYAVTIMEKLMNDKDYYSCENCGARGKYRS